MARCHLAKSAAAQPIGSHADRAHVVLPKPSPAANRSHHPDEPDGVGANRRSRSLALA
ncbi:MAG: hypothetical protein ACLQNE_12250 [Thermoguttaceae bacterium]